MVAHKKWNAHALAYIDFGQYGTQLVSILLQWLTMFMLTTRTQCSTWPTNFSCCNDYGYNRLRY